ncbi:MAG: autotransporter outer membrane beta-barrel domain-containing protein, partial [Fusobacteriales bacterium]|nr:autotransporter outer membrane beta-barrel domain-containing protein [Fusobacteriales bacterium]
MKKVGYKHLFALSALLTSSAYSVSFNDYTDYRIGENREITVTGADEFALFGVVDASFAYGFTTWAGGHIGTMAEVGQPGYTLFYGVGGAVNIGALYQFPDGLGDYSIDPSTITAVSNNDLVLWAQPWSDNFLRLKGLRVLLNNELTGPGMGFYIGENQSAEWDGSVVEYRGADKGVYLENNTSLLMKDSQFIYANTSGNSYGIYAPGNGKIEVDTSSLVLVKGDIDAVVVENNSELIMGGMVVTEYGSAVKADSSGVEINGMLLSYNSDKVIDSKDSKVINNGNILIELDNNGTAFYAENNKEAKNYGTIASFDRTVKIVSGSNQYSGHFLNAGTITARNPGGTAIEFDSGDNVLELGNNSAVRGKIDGGAGSNIFISSGNVTFDEINNFEKIVSSGNSVINGTVNLKPAADVDTYYSNAFGNVKSIAADFSADTSVGDLTINGTVNVGVDYDGINSETEKTGKIIAGSVVLNGGKIVLTNAGSTAKNILEEAEQVSEKSKVRIKNIIISNKLQAVDPSFNFGVTQELKETEGWIREAVSRVENGVTVVDQVYSKIGLTPDMGIKPDPGQQEAEIEAKLNPVPRNRVDFDNANKIGRASERFLNMEASDMISGERRQSIEYLGLKSNFDAENKYNYDYNVNTNGIMGTTLHKHAEYLYSGFTLGYTNNSVSYSNDDDEKVKSFNINVFGRYTKENFDIDAHLQYGYNEHELNADWLGTGRKESSYNSHVVKGGLSAGYNRKITSGIKIRPNIGIDYVYVKEDVITTDGLN